MSGYDPYQRPRYASYGQERDTDREGRYSGVDQGRRERGEERGGYGAGFVSERQGEQDRERPGVDLPRGGGGPYGERGGRGLAGSGHAERGRPYGSAVTGYGSSPHHGDLDRDRGESASGQRTYGERRAAPSGYGSEAGRGWQVGAGSSGPRGEDRHRNAGRGYPEGRAYGGGRDEPGFFERTGERIASWVGADDDRGGREAGAYRGAEGARHHRGRGPRGYARSDDRIREDINDRLTDDYYVDATDIEVAVSATEVTLSGIVDSRQARHRAEDIAESVSGVTHVQNDLRVRRERPGTGAGLGSPVGAASGSGTVGTTGGTGVAARAQGGSGGTGVESSTLTDTSPGTGTATVTPTGAADTAKPATTG
jgi:osmotically-inducible protein OsmY